MNLMKYAVVLLLACVTTVARAGTHHYYYTDPQGTVLAKADASGAIVATYDYAPYGMAVASMSPAPNGPGYTGHVNDPDTGLVYMQARYYDPAVGRFLSSDPVKPTPGNAFNFNPYTYANNNPIINFDPSGRETCDIECKRQRQEQDRRRRNAPYTGGGILVGRATATGRATDAIGSALFGTRFNLIKRPENPTKIPDKLAHELFMTGAAGEIVALAPYAGLVGGSVAPVAVDAGGVVAGVTGDVMLRYGGRAAMIGCLSVSCHGEDLPDQYVADRKILQEMYEEAKIVGYQAFKQVFQDGKN
ncbi:RHS repeat-associated core domain-containing protein [Rhodanobacter sp. Soil772]|uniref:RHS repeat-associated core domain-containing protein n=1 Tax=Rhodanobacter sp. Soil772 TaxID=1736406 RepID=UPI000A4EC96C|nr:RHS repeat-associated core domain-containing protein [Rhodanobacter sp. Soil772]